MCYEGFWTYRESTDLIFVVTGGEDWVLENFSEFCRMIVSSPDKDVQLYDRSDAILGVEVQWSKLTCIAAQVDKTMRNRREGAKRNEHLHVKFFFDVNYMRRKKLFGRFRISEYDRQLRDMKAYWDPKKVGSPEQVAETNTTYDEVVVDGPLITDGRASVPKTLPVKNVYVVASGYRDTFMK